LPNPDQAPAVAEPLDPADPQPFLDFVAARGQLIGADPETGTVLCWNEEGHPVRVYGGWLAVLVDGDEKLHFDARGNLGGTRSRWVKAGD